MMEERQARGKLVFCPRIPQALPEKKVVDAPLTPAHDEGGDGARPGEGELSILSPELPELLTELALKNG